MNLFARLSTGLLCLSIVNPYLLAATQSHWNKQDDLAFSSLVKTLQYTSKKEKEFTLENTLKFFPLEKSTTSFTNLAPEVFDQDYPSIDSANVFPSKKPEGVSADEWQALLATKLEFFGENGNVSYELIDLDQDGFRDLIVDAYMGGTGLFNEIYLLKREKNRFIPNIHEKEEGYFYSLNGRGSNQFGHWIEINKQIYLLYRDSLFGQDRLQLKKPLADNSQSPIIQISYTYEFSIDKTQVTVEGEKYQLDDKTYTALLKAIKPLNTLSASREATDSIQPLCPNLTEDQAYNLGPGHYPFEIIANFPVWINKECYFGRVINWFGSYQKDGLFAQLWYAHPDTPDNIREIQVFARRKVTAIHSQTN